MVIFTVMIASIIIMSVIITTSIYIFINIVAEISMVVHNFETVYAGIDIEDHCFSFDQSTKLGSLHYESMPLFCVSI